ncbi:uncharacterized protein KY384_001664 [Bacidia gigantensis]|uniref:uncharacterized protein n=1 Tax=Bacidia gigantensis TaxID=2732470 RepID=UPI001D03D142|nr:uncharacterized protein KY384_001664 [Bacidia gigantensis]KAG8533923.1 hypothetical protein KY384_001664 [Bacidia gigantensis]
MNSPSDFADPSPIATSSTGTDTTDIDDVVQEQEQESTQEPEPAQSITPGAPKPARPGLGLETKMAAKQAQKPRSDEDEEPSSVIHAPTGFEAFKRATPKSPPLIRRTTPTAQQRSEIIVSPPEDEKEKESRPPRPTTWPNAESSEASSSPPPIQTTIPPARDWSATPRAQSRAEMELSPDEDKKRPVSRSSSRASNLAGALIILGVRIVLTTSDIPENGEDNQRTPNPSSSLFEDTVERLQEQNDEVAALNVALKECWTLCNTLAGLSYVHRERIFSFSGKGDRQQQAWKSCWKLCQKLYDTRDEESTVRPTLDLCREFCQCLFDIRRRDNEAADSVLRVSFEMNNHLYNTHDRTLPEAFRERTLDFYITLCHRLMKQRTEMAQETDLLLGACWSLAEMLFSLRQNKRDGKPADEELLGSAIQACWELCDLFREGWTQIRPDRGTPRPSQTTFTQAFQQAKQSQAHSTASYTTVPEYEDSEDEGFSSLNPETPTTIFEDTNQISPDGDEGPTPNILVLGPNDQDTPQKRPPYNSSTRNLSSSNLSQNNKTVTSASSTSTNTIKNHQNTLLTNGTPSKMAIKKKIPI